MSSSLSIGQMNQRTHTDMRLSMCFAMQNKLVFIFLLNFTFISCKIVPFSPPDEVRWIQLITPCSPGQVITPDLRRPHKGTLSPRPTLTPTPSLARLTPATHLAHHMHGQVTHGASTQGTTLTQGN